jgi:cold shock CspA family protein
MGKMLRWNMDRGFGFIAPDDGGADLFCHVRSLKDGEGSVRDGDTVEFKIEYDDRKGKEQAVSVRKVGGGGGGRGRDSRSPARQRYKSKSRSRDRGGKRDRSRGRGRSRSDSRDRKRSRSRS